VLPDELASLVQARVRGRAPEQSLAQLRAALARAILAVDPDGAADRHREARRDRRVSVQAEPDGMGSLWALLTASDAAGAYQWLTRLARGLGQSYRQCSSDSEDGHYDRHCHQHCRWCNYISDDEHKVQTAAVRRLPSKFPVPSTKNSPRNRLRLGTVVVTHLDFVQMA